MLEKLEDIQKLIDNGVEEGKTIEYKREGYRLDSQDVGHRKAQHEELLKDVSSFANTIGGCLILGVVEENGLPISICGMECNDPDALKLRLTQIIEQGLEPRVNCTIRTMAQGLGKCVVVVEVLQSMIAPHRVVYQGHFGQFWARNSAGAFRMDTSELRQSFTFSTTMFERIRAFRTERCRQICSGETPVPMPDGPKIILHLIPQESFSNRLSIAPSILEASANQLHPLGSTGYWSHRFNMDGIAVFTGGDYGEGKRSGYVQLFRNGIIESVSEDIVYSIPSDSTNARYFRRQYEHYLVQSLPKYLKCLEDLGIGPPAWCFLTLIGVKNVAIRLNRSFYNSQQSIDRDTLSLPEIQITDMAAKPLDVLIPLFDMIWNAAGFPKCLSFDSEGVWRDT